MTAWVAELETDTMTVFYGGSPPESSLRRMELRHSRPTRSAQGDGGSEGDGDA